VRRQARQPRRVRVTVSDRSDPWIGGLTILLVLGGMMFVLDTSYFYSLHHYGDGYHMILRQSLALALGVVLLRLLAGCRSDLLQRYAGFVFGVCAFLTLLPLVPGIGYCANGACRWISLGFVRLQPAELAKVAFVIYLAATLTARSNRLRDWRQGMLPTLLVMGGLALSLLLEPDYGTAMLVLLLGVTIMFLAGVPSFHLLVLSVLGAAAGGGLLWAEPYRIRRLLCFLNPWEEPTGACYQLVQSYRTFGSGGLKGIGIGASMQKTGWLPEAHTDFVFSIIGEEAGLIGALLVLLAFCLLAYRGFRVAHRHPEPFGQLLAAGVTLVLVVQAFMNMGVVLGVLPTKGLVLPFFSYGGSSLLVTLASIGILMSLSRELRER